MKNELDLEIISKSFLNLSKAAEIPVKVLSPAVHKYQKEFEMQPVLEEELPNFCKDNGCSERGLKCKYCPAMSRRAMDKLGDKWLKE